MDMPAIQIPNNIKTFITDKINEVLNKDLYNVTIETLGKRIVDDVLLNDYKFTLTEIISSLPTITFYKIESTGGTFNIPTNEQSYMVVDSLVPSFTLEFNGTNGATFTNNYNVNDFSDCYLDITNTSLVSSNKSQVYVTDNVSFSTVNNEFFTFYYFNTGSLILGFSPASATLQAPTEIPDPADLPSLPEPEPFIYDVTFEFDGNGIVSLSANESEGMGIVLRTNVPDNTLVPYTITGVSPEDIDIPLTGVFTINGNHNLLPFTISDDLSIQGTEGTETMVITLDGITPTVSASLVINDTSLTYTYDVTFELDGVVALSANEGDTMGIVIRTDALTGTLIPYTVTGISSSDINIPLSGFVEIQDGGNYEFQIPFTIMEDLSTDGSKTMIVTLDNITPTVSAALIINDTSLTPTETYELSVWQFDLPVSNVNEGAQSIEFLLLTTNVTGGTILPYTITGIDGNDTSVLSLTGNLEVVIYNNNLGSARVLLDISEDMLTEGTETLIVTLDNITPTVSAALIINDTSLTTTYNTVTAMIGIDGQPSSPYVVLVEADAQMRQDFVDLMQLNDTGDYIEPLTTSGQFILASNSLFIAESPYYGPDDTYPGPLSAMFFNASFPRDFLVLNTILSSWIYGQYVIDSNGVYVAQHMVYSDQNAYFTDPNPVGVTFTEYLTCEWIRTGFGTTNNYIDSLEIV